MIFIKSDRRYLDTIIILMLLMVFIITSILYLDIFPKVWMDEAWDSTTAYTFQKDGTFRNLTLVSAARGNQDIHFLQPRILSNLVMAPIFSLLGVGSVQGRLASILMGGVAVIGIYLLARKIGGVVFSSLCALFFIFDNLFFVVTRTIRPEIFVTGLAIWALLQILDGRTSYWKLVIGGVLLGISLYAHPNSVLVLVAILIISLFQVKTNQYWQTLAPVILGIVIGLLPYALYVAYQDGANHFRDFWLQIHERADMLTHVQNYFSSASSAELERYTSYIFFPYRLPIFLIQIIAIGYSFYKRGDKFNQIFLIFIFVHVLLFPILISAKTPRYMTVLMPIVSILVIKMVWDFANWSYDITLSEISAKIPELHLSALVSIFLALILFINQVGGDFWAVWQSRGCSFSPFIAQVRSFVPSGKRVWGPMTYWFGFYDYPYRTPYTIDNYEGMSGFQPEYIILYDTEIWGNQMGVTKRTDPSYEKMEPVRDLLSQLVKDRGNLVGSVPNSCYGNVEIFKLDW